MPAVVVLNFKDSTGNTTLFNIHALDFSVLKSDH